MEKEQYYVALRETQQSLKRHPDLNPWFFSFLKTLEQQTGSLRKELLPPKQGTFTEREEAVYHAIERYQPVTIGFLERETKIKRPTLKTILARLKKQGVVEMEGERKGSRYRLKRS